VCGQTTSNEVWMFGAEAEAAIVKARDTRTIPQQHTLHIYKEMYA